MNKKCLNILLIVTMLITSSLFGCNVKQEVAVENKITADTPYYSITTNVAGHQINSYMDVDIKIPKITYSGNEKDDLFDNINNEIYDNLSKLILAAEDNAYTTYKEYLETAKNNFKEDYKNKLKNLESKYEGIIGEEEINLIKTLLASASEINFEFNNIATIANAIKNGPDVFSHTGTDTLIIPELHNKKIIVIETTAASDSNDESQSTFHIEGRPNASNNTRNWDFTNEENMSRGYGDYQFNPNRGGKRRASRSNINTDDISETSEQSNETSFTAIETSSSIVESSSYEANEQNNETSTSITETSTDESTDIENEKTETTLQDSAILAIVEEETTSTVSNIEKELTIEDFYTDLINIVYSKAPNDAELTRLYTPTEINCNFDVKCLDEDYLSLFLELRETKTVSKISRFFYNIDLRQKKIVKLNDVLGENYKEICINTINDAISKFSDEEKSNLKSNYNIDDYINEDTAFFINNNHMPVVELDKWSISNNYLEFQIIM